MADYQGSLTGAQIDALPGKIGELSNLTTGNKTSLVAAVNEVNASSESGAASVAAGNKAAVEQLVLDNAARDFRGVPTMGGQPMVLFCSAETPAEATVPDNWKQFDPDTEEGYNWDGTPTLIGQRYVYTPDSGDGAEYVAVRADATAYTLRWMKV